ncbi:MAG: T9SS type A sorting domain-containing protein, partial [Chlorobi bacterium]|nr:T9SS type A sorting domain-containing protein [Chlorobiota bacterium]
TDWPGKNTAFEISTIATDVEKDRSENLPKKFVLYQNYPNPFNPSTTIKYQIPSNVKSETSNTKLIVYDILGREVATLVNEKQKPGNYEIVFNASNLPSGIYFYSMHAGEFNSVKKMILLK